MANKRTLDQMKNAWVGLVVSVSACFLCATSGQARPRAAHPTGARSRAAPQVVYEKKTALDFEGAEIEGELKKPAEFYFQHRPEERFESLVQRRTQFHRELLRDAVLSK